MMSIAIGVQARAMEALSTRSTQPAIRSPPGTFDRSFDDTFDNRALGSSFDHTLNQTLDSVPEYSCNDGVEVQLATNSPPSHVEDLISKNFSATCTKMY